jgi:TM2 domain-containing membrane protein YozV
VSSGECENVDPRDAGVASPNSLSRMRELLRLASVGIVIMANPGSTGNVIAALASFFIPGLGQLLQGKLLKALIMFVAAAVLWWFMLGWIIHLWSIIDAALYKRPDVAG